MKRDGIMLGPNLLSAIPQASGVQTQLHNVFLKVLQVAWKGWEELSDQYVTRLLDYVGFPSPHHHPSTPVSLAPKWSMI